MNVSAQLAYASALLAGLMALGVAFYEWRPFASRFFVAGMGLLALEALFSGLAADALAPEEVVYWENWALLGKALLPGVWLVFSLSYARGDARESLRKWRWGIAATFLLPVGLAVIGWRRLILSVSQTQGGRQWVVSLAGGGVVLHLLLLLGSLLVIMNLERTFRAAVGTMRWRIKFMVLGLGVLFAARAYTCTQALFFHAAYAPLQPVNSMALLLACLLILRSLLRSGHFEVGVYPSPVVLHSSLTILLAGIYLVLAGGLAKLASFVGGDASFQLKTFVILVALVLLAVLLLSDKIRLRLKRFVSRHFQRPLYDYRSVWRTFSEATARRLEPGELCAALVKLVSDVFQALSVSIWLVDDRRETLAFAASTSLSPANAAQLRLSPEEASEVIGALSGRAQPIDLDASREIWAAALRRSHPEEFHRAGNRVCVPLAAGGELLGAMLVGDRVGGIPFSPQDFDVLQAVGDQAAASLLNIQLSQRLAQGKQIEAFQAMSAFFVHDLKNTAYTLSLMLKNLPLYYQDPEFREDALRDVSRSVTHINDLIARLGLLRQDLAIRPVQSDLNQIVSQALKEWPRLPGVELATELRPLPQVLADPAQVQKVVINLLLNASDALGASGRICVETSRRTGWVALTVADNGCGMTAEFIERSLFRPFQTTKKNGLGIGMFHCKAIVEAHRGRIEVQSDPGNGTSFRVLLPAA
jgi:putative PEP-CTERM system histidine kinase